MEKEQSPQSFEQAMDRLEAIVRGLESGKAPLESSLSLFEEGTGLIKYCQGLLDDAAQKVMLLQKGADGKPEVVPFGGEDAE